MIRSFLLLVLICFVSCPIYASNINYPVSEIPEALLKDADAVIRLHSVTKEISSDGKVITHEFFVVTIFNKSAQSLGYFSEQYDDLCTVYDYSMTMYDKAGNYIDKAKTKDFVDVKAYDGFTLFDDNRLIYNNWYNTNYPYTMEIKFSRTDKQTLSLGGWNPVISYNVSVQSASFMVTTPLNDSIRFKEVNMPTKVIRAIEKNMLKYAWSLYSFEAIKSEPFMPFYEDIFPLVRIAANKFSYDGFSGIMTDWKSFGEWEWNLINGRDKLSEDAILKIKSLTNNIPNNEAKIEYLYKYLQDNTRYVGVQLGIGGYQPFEATLVDETKYGDCKALSNYMKALLKAVDIDSDFVLIKSGKQTNSIDVNFASNQFNHAILCIPNKGDTIWLECTDQKQPFGFLGSFTENRPCLLITNDGGKIVKTPEYRRDTNTQFSQVNFKIDTMGNCVLTNTTLYKALQYENVAPYFYQTPKEQKDKLYEKINIPNTTIKSFTFNLINESLPTATLKFELAINKFASINGNRMFVPLNPLNANTYIPENIKNRKYPIVLKSCGYDADTVVFELPANYSIESIPQPVVIESPYGIYSARIDVKENQGTYIRSYKWNKGEFPAEDYNKVRDFYKAVASADKAKLVLIK